MAYYRDVSVDILRGIAIFTMVAANMLPYVLAEPAPFWFRFYGTFAAPLFVLLSGMMVAFTTQTKGHGLKYFLVRGLLVVAVGALVDVLGYIYPFTTVDVLYLIGISLPVAYLFTRLNTKSQWALIILIFLVTPVLQLILGYTDYPTEFYLSGELKTVVQNQTSILNHWIVDGWFPIFPWLGFSFLGATLANLRWKYKSYTTFGKNTILLIGIGTLVFGSVIWWLYPGELLTRAGYSELFYPPTIGYIMSAIGLIVILFYIVDKWSSAIVCKPLQALGESSLFIYILHLALINYVIYPFAQSAEDFQTFLLIYIILVSCLILIGYGLRALKTKWSRRPFIIRFFLGG